MKLKKILSSVIAAAMVLSSIGTAFAYEEPIAKAVEEVETVALQTAAVSEEDAKVTVEFSSGLTLYYDSLKQAMDVGSSGTKTIIVHEDITEEINNLQGNITTDNPNGVTITSTYNNWIECSGFSESLTIGENITFKAPNGGLFVYDENCVINGTVIVDAYYQRYGGSKLTINEPGSMTVTSETFIVRFMDGDPNAGIYIVGDNDNSTVGLTAQVIYFYQGMINAKDANIKVGTYWQTNTTDNEGSANLVLDNSTLDVTVNEHKAKATGNSTVTVKNGSEMNVAGGFEQGENATVSVDSTSSIAKNGTSVYVASIGEEPYETLQEAYDAATSSDTITLLSDVTVSDWQYINNKGVTLNGNNKTITVESVNENTISNGGMMFRSESADEDINISNVTFNLCDTAMVAYTVEGNFENVTINGGKYGLNLSGATQVSNCTFNSQKREAIYFKDVTGAPGAVIEKCTFNLASKRVGALWSNEVFKNNTINYEGEAITGLTILSNSSATVSGNVMSADTKLEFYVPDNSPAAFTLTENNIAGSVFVDGAEVADQFDGATIENNTLSAEALAGLQLIKSDMVSVDPVATLNGKGYYNLQDAVEAAADGDEIVLLNDAAVSLINRPNGPTLTSAVTINLGGKTLTLNKDNLFKADITFKNGTIISNENVGTAPIWTGYGTDDVNVTLENVVYNAENLGGMAIINVEDPGAIITIKNSEINAKNFTYVNGSVIYSNGATVDIDDSTITADNIGVGLNYVNGSLNNTKMLVTNSLYGILGMDDSSLTIEGNSEIKIIDSEAADLGYMLTSALPEYTGSITVTEPAKLLYDTKMDAFTVNGETAVAKANTINVVFKNNDEDTDSTTTQYDIYLVGANGEKIYELASADLTFVNTSEQANGAAIPYKVTGKNDIAVSKNGDNNYLFNFDGYTKWQDTDSEILIGQVTFTGYGALDFKVDKEAKNEKDEYSNVANATKLINNIVDTFTIDGTVAKLVVNEDIDGDGEYVGVIDDTNEVATNNLTINVDFNNAVEKNIDDYQDMTVTVSGGDLADDIIINLGDADKDETLTFDDKTNAKYTVDASVDNKYVITVEDVLSVNNTYTVTVTGAGYRTVSYDVHMTDDKELTFWNNVMDAPKAVEKNLATGAEAELKNVTFLAGDIVKDDNINIYDLSAVVSYFATETTTTGYDEKAQYDLNRDGMIDSKDVAYVLVSWGK